MTDVRLTATNPEDSSVVPVACNSRGELLIEEVKIEAIENDVTINGVLNVRFDDADYGLGTWRTALGGVLELTWDGRESPTHQFARKGGVTHLRTDYLDGRTVNLCQGAGPYFSTYDGHGYTFKVDWDGNAFAKSFQILAEPGKRSNFVQADNADPDDPSALEYSGEVIDVGKELEFLRAQVRAVMEKLKMVPEGGWEVWDGSA